MPRNYKKKRPCPRYTQDDIQKAVNDIENKNRTYQQAEDFYGIPKSVIFHRIKGRKISIQRMGVGRPSVLSIEVENELENCIKAKARMGYLCDREEIKSVVAHRHPKLSFKKPEHLQKCRKDSRNPEVIYDFYDDLKKIIKEYKFDGPSKSCFIFNSDESGFHLDPQRLKAVGEKGKPLVRIWGGSGRDSISVLATIAADGSVFPPLIIFKGVAVQARWTSTEAYPGTVYSTSSNGWMEEPQFFEWFSTWAVWKETMTCKNIIKGFESTGIFPFDSSKFPESEFNLVELKKYKERKAAEAKTNLEDKDLSSELSANLTNMANSLEDQGLTSSAKQFKKKKTLENTPIKKKSSEKSKKAVGLNRKKKQNLAKEVDDSEDEDQALCQDNSDDDDYAEAVGPETNYEEPQWSNIKPGTYILVDFLGGARKTMHYKYVCCVETIDEEEGDILVQG
ncbi:hypothetical protein NQ314_009721 [Rhamnusium bicolor]|uniref:DDE-1 domain-containing protein n=1 Tax=Rhamnusium bicolor TaxID=1586634 RepID=A0AAV8XX96_9CUCU|nr:hypothetical protein NQ314_009721 [Rhamnusium bicolor]